MKITDEQLRHFGVTREQYERDVQALKDLVVALKEVSRSKTQEKQIH